MHWKDRKLIAQILRDSFTRAQDLAPVLALERMVALVGETGRWHHVAHPAMQENDGGQIVVARYSSERESRSAFHATGVVCANGILTIRP